MPEVSPNADNAIATIVATASILPAPIQTGFWKAAGRLVGGALATPAAWLRRPAQAIEDKTDAQSLVTRKIAEAVAERAASDPEIVERAMQSFVREEFRKQENKEGVLKAASEALSEPQSENLNAASDLIDDDWMNVFVRYAEDASSERMQKLWGRVLAGEIRGPGTFSLSTIRFLSELDTHIAKVFEIVASSLTGDLIYFDIQNDNLIFNHCLELESAGLANVGAGMLSKNYKINDEGRIHVVGASMCLEIIGKPQADFSVPVIVLTRLGREIRKLLPSNDEIEQFRRMSKKLENDASINKIMLCQLLKEESQPTRALAVETLFERSVS